jgi:iron complex transport system substrate-binding protein
LLLLLLPLGCAVTPSISSSDPVESETVASSPSAATRVVALSSMTADMIHQLDANKLVGMSGSRLLSQKPGFEAIPRVSEGRTQPNLEAIVALEPDLVIGAAGFHDQVLDKLQSMTIGTLSTEVNSWRSLQDLTRTIAAVVQANPEPLLQQYQQCLPDQPAPDGTTTLVLVNRQPLLSPNKTSWAGDLLTQFGVINLAAELQGQSPIGGYVTLSPEKVLASNPDILLLVSAEGENPEDFKSEPFWGDLKAVQTDQVHVLDYYGLINPGSIDAIAQACEQLKNIYFPN